MQRECRGLVLDEAKDWAVVAMPYTRFFNYGERWASSIDWATAKVFEKMDGSLMTMVRYAVMGIIATWPAYKPHSRRFRHHNHDASLQ